MIQKILNIIFPPKCVFCGEMLKFNIEEEACDKCFSKLNFIKNPFNTVAGLNYCDGVICALEYSGNLKDAIKKFKFQGKPGFGRLFGKIFYESAKDYINQFDLIIPVPLHKERQLERGYNQSNLIAKEVARLSKIPLGKNILIRIKKTKTQSLLTKLERSQNIKNSFEIKGNFKISAKKILIIDDILTTGSTIEECCKILKMAGTKTVIAGVIASGKDFN